MRDQPVNDLATRLGRKPSRAGQVRRSSGTLLSWDAANLRGTVAWNGTVISDIPLLGAIDAFAWQAGDEVVIDTIPGTSGGFSSPMILGRVFRPGAANAAKVLQGLQNEFAAQVSAEIFGEAIRSADAPDEVITTSTGGSFVGLTGGPTISDVSIGTSGRALVFASASMSCAPTGLDASVSCYMSYEVTGATSVAASTATAVRLRFLRGDGDPLFHPQAGLSASRVSLADGLNPGVHTFTAQYRVDEFNASDEGSFFARNLTVIPF